ncbi:Zinc finger, RING/FYVE/PHD-type [Phytophthora cactorum]|nr:Zinc finger, RING/FYVE/PHD-type [Phytophthora cactorum]
MKTMNASPCGGCGEDVGNVHQCPDCNRSMHTFCGTPVGAEGFGQRIRCPDCSSSHQATELQITSSSSIVAAFARSHRQVSTKNGVKPSSTIATSTPERPTSTSMTPAAPGVRLSECTLSPCASASAQVVTTIAQRRKVLQWMVKTEELHGDEKLFSKAVDQFPSIFKSKTRRVNVDKAGDWWRKRAQFLEAPRGSTVVSGRSSKHQEQRLRGLS